MLYKTNTQSTNTRKSTRLSIFSSPFGNEGYTLTSGRDTVKSTYSRSGYRCKKSPERVKLDLRPEILSYYVYEYINVSTENVK